MNWEEIEQKFGKHPDGTIFESAEWAIRLAKHLEKQQRQYNMNERDELFISRIFDYHEAKDVDPIRFQEIRAAARIMARAVLANGGENRQEDLMKSIEHIRIALFFAIASIVVPKGENE